MPIPYAAGNDPANRVAADPRQPSTISVTSREHSTDINVDGHDTATDDKTTQFALSGPADKHTAAIALAVVNAEDAKRQEIEDARSIKRNTNRMYTLIFALICSVVVTYLLSTMLKGTWVGTTFGPYSFAITILFDSTLTVWALVHRY